MSQMSAAADPRTRRVVRSILASLGNKGVAILVSLLLVPVTIGYLDTEQYGIWLTLSSITAWISYFDVGLAHGFRNRFAEALAQGDTALGRRYVSTTYVVLAMIFGVVLLLSLWVNGQVSWASLLHLQLDDALLRSVVMVMLSGVAVSFVLNVASVMLIADQHPATASMITTAGQVLSLLLIWVLTLTTQGDLRALSLVMSWVPVGVVLLVSCYLFARPYRLFAPSLHCVDFSLVRRILGLGGKFFVIQLSMLLIFQLANVIISRQLGASAVTEYNVAYRYYSVALMLFNIILSPLWSAYTEAYVKGDYDWMKRTLRRMERIWLLLCVGELLLLVVSPWAFRWWLGESVGVSGSVSLCMMLYLMILSGSNMYMVVINGIGKVMLQMLIYVGCACVSLPLSYTLCSYWGIPGLLVVFTAVYLLQAIAARWQLHRLLQGTCTGLLNR